ncbi:MAG TPA: hypothetical protein VEU72_01195 [Nitrosopumilaceae archaeon]|nr:hypothetical protein [Nitrosopumilaceae archaeon]
MQIFSTTLYLKISVIAALVFVPTMAYADDGMGFNTASTLGWLAIGCGMAANLSLVIFKMVRKIPVMKLVGGSCTSQGLTSMYQPVLNFHIMLNSVGFFAGLSHGFMLIGGLDYISLSLVIVMTVSMISGIILRLASGKNLKFFSRLVHGQAILAALLVTLVVLHVITRWHHGIIMNYI